jgi:putative nucleotidyltransferase with HDIG domain
MINLPNFSSILPLLEKIRSTLPDQPVYLVGGAVRDILLGRVTHDLDFVVPAGGSRAARRVADAIGASYFPLDEARDTGRVVWLAPDGSRQILDFSVYRGPDLESDLRARDFTVNAMALALDQPGTLVDPLGGASDLVRRRLRACSPATFSDDPLRTLRAIRMAAVFKLQMAAETRRALNPAVPGLARVSPERLRDELFKILDSPQPHVSLRVMDLTGALPYTFPELLQLKGVGQSPPHVLDVWEHTLDVLRYLEILLEVLKPNPDPDLSASLYMGLVSMRLGRYREQLAEHLSTPLNADRSLRPLLFMAALYHDVAKPQTRQVEESGRVRFFEHDQIGGEVVNARGRAQRLSNPECERLQTIVRHHMRPHHLAQSGEPPTRRAIFRFFRAAGAAGVDIALLSLADVLATYGQTLTPEIWNRQLEVVRDLLEAWWERKEESVSPPPLLTGHEIMTALQIGSGPAVGGYLEALREAQAVGQISSKEEAFDLVKALASANQG